MKTFTPYCTFTFNCKKYTESCENCPVAPKRKLKDIESSYMKIESILNSADFSNAEIIVANDLKKEINCKTVFGEKQKLKSLLKFFRCI